MRGNEHTLVLLLKRQFSLTIKKKDKVKLRGISNIIYQYLKKGLEIKERLKSYSRLKENYGEIIIKFNV